MDPLIEWLFELRGPSLKWDLDTARAFDACLGHPGRHFPIAHVGGTNGKGSVAAMIQAIARAAGLRTGLSTSPHLVCPTERIRVDDVPIPVDRLIATIAALRERADSASRAGSLPRYPSFFEMMTAAALVTFREHAVELGVLEVGLGGRLDATNVVTPAVTVVTTIALDHVKTLGGSLASIAKEKAGIIKPGVPVVIGPLPDVARDVMRAVARERGAPLHEMAAEVAVREHADGSIDIRTPKARYERIALALAGTHQRVNAALAVRAIELVRERVGLRLPDRAVTAGLGRVDWPGRLESIGARPRVLLDAAHNVEGAQALGAHLAREDERCGRPAQRVLVFGITEGRDAEALFAPMAPHVDCVIVVTPEIVKAQPAPDVARALASHTESVVSEASVLAALERAREAAGPDGEVLVAGSLYLVGDARRALLALEGSGHPRRESVPDTEPRP